MKNPYELLEMCLQNWDFAAHEPLICKRLLLSKKTAGGDEFLAAILRALILFAGNWRSAAEYVAAHGGDRNRVKKFEAWATGKTSAPRRGLLLEWKGGAL